MSETAKKILILGGGTGGIAAATRLRRLDDRFEITIVDRSGEIAFLPCSLPYYISGTVDCREMLFPRTAEELRKCYRLDILTGHDAIRIDRSSRQLVVRDLKTHAETSIAYDKLILSPGASPILPHVPGMELPLVKTVHTPSDAEEILAILNKEPNSPNPVVVLGGGLLGLEMIEAFSRRRIPVILVEAAKQVLIGADIEMVAPLQQELQTRGVRLLLDVSLTKLEPESDRLIRLSFSDKEDITARFVVAVVGVQPEVSLALDAGLKVG